MKSNEKILLIGNPNVGKSVIFTELTGVHALSSNFAGTTVSYMEGSITIGATEYILIDVPGIYSLATTSDAERIATSFVESGAKAIICVLDASNLGRNLCLALEMKKLNIPTVYVLNLMDVAERRGISIKVKLLEQELCSPVVPTVAVKKIGIDDITQKLDDVINKKILAPSSSNIDCHCEVSSDRSECFTDDIWCTAKSINSKVSSVNKLTPSFIDRIGDAMMLPFPGIPIAVLVMGVLFAVVRFGGGGLRSVFTLLTDRIVIPFFRNLFEHVFAYFQTEGGHLCYRYLIYEDGFKTKLKLFYENNWIITDVPAHTVCNQLSCLSMNVLIGEYGIFVICFQWIIALILPYVFAFYLSVTFLEDSGYLPRISVLFDNIMQKLGVQGGSLIHVILALGCAIPAIIGSRTATTQKERLMIVAMICFTIPCISQLGAMTSLMTAPAFAWWLAPVMFLLGLCLFFTTAIIAGKVIKGKVEPLILEVPNLLIPNSKAYFRKLKIRMKHFMLDAEIPMLIAVFIAAILAGTGIINIIAENRHVQSIVSEWLGLPKEAVISLILGIVRREMSVVPLLALNLTHLQALVAGVISLLYLPCLSVTGILAKEFKLKVACIIFFGTIISAILVGGLINQFVSLFV